MPCSYCFEEDILKYSATGEYPSQELYEMIEESFHDSRFANGIKILIDVTKSIKSITSENARTFANYLKSKNEFLGSKIAITVSKTANYGLGRMVSAFAEDIDLQVSVFYNPDAAKKWLNYS